MKEITIAQIREKANDIKTLNEGHLLYQRKEYSNFDYKLSKYHGLVLEGVCNFPGHSTKLQLGDKIASNCTCDTGFCKHKVALYFLLKDTLTKLNKENTNLDLIAQYDISEVITSFTDEVKKNYAKYQIYPILDFSRNQVSINLLLKYNGFESVIKEIYNFIESYKQNLKYYVGTTVILNTKSNYNEQSIRLLELLVLYDSKTNIYSNNIIEDIYNIYRDDYLLLSSNRFQKVYFKESDFPIKFKYSDKKLILTECVEIIKSLTKSFILIENDLYVFNNNNDSKLLSLLSFEKKDNVIFSFDETNEVLFYTNIYSGLEKYVELDDNKAIIPFINSVLEYQNNQLLVTGSLVDQFDKPLELKIKTIKEIEFEEMLLSLGFYYLNDYFRLDNPCQIVEVMCNRISELANFGKVLVSSSCDNISKFKGAKFNYSIGLDGSFFDIVFTDLKYNKNELDEIFKGYELKKNYVKLDDGKLVYLDDEGYDLYKLFKDFGIKDVDNKSKIELPFYQVYKLSTFKNLMNDTKLFDDFYNDFVNYSNEESLPMNIKNVLRDYQIKGFNWLSVLHKYHLGGILADDMGLGKTIEVIALISTVKRTKPILIVSPTSLVLNWVAEFKKFNSNLNVKPIYGNAFSRSEEILNIKEDDIIITSYESVRIDIDLFSKYEYDLIIADEAQYMKNPSAYKTIAMKKLKASSNIALTGTPIENNIVDLWSIFDFVLPGYLPNKRDFLHLYSNTEIGIRNLSKQVLPFILRREKQNVLTLPPKIENNVYAFLEGNQYKAYEAYLYNVQQELQSNDYQIAHVLKTLIRLREFMCEPRLFIDNYDGENAKLKTLMEIVLESISDGHRILLFSSFPSVFKYIASEFKKQNISYDILDGKTKKEERINKVNNFNSNQDIKVFLISLKVGGSGLNLTGADMVIHYDPWWNVAATNQATDRAYRIGQDKEVHVIKLIVKDTIEEKILKLQEKKAKLSSDVLDDTSFVKQLTKEDIIELFGGKK